MRNWITLIESSNEIPVEEGKFGNMMAAAALAGTFGSYMAKSDNAAADEPTPISQMADEEGWEVKYGYDDSDSPPPKIDSNDGKEAKAKAKSEQKAPKLDEATRLLALTMWGEARSDGPEAMRAVGHVIMNRIKSKRKFGASIKAVVWKRKAFSCWNKGDPNRDAMKKIAGLPDTNLNKVRWKQAVKIAKEIRAGQSDDKTNGALFYHTKAISPYWVDPKAKVVADIANHVFYRHDRKAPVKKKA